MTFRQFLLLVVIAVGVAVLVPFVTRAAEPSCVSPEQFSADIKDGSIVGAAYYRGDVTDQMIVVETSNAIVIYGFKDGCLVAVVSLEPRAQGVPA